jgi:hypothetical protein
LYGVQREKSSQTFDGMEGAENAMHSVNHGGVFFKGQQIGLGSNQVLAGLYHELANDLRIVRQIVDSGKPGFRLWHFGVEGVLEAQQIGHIRIRLRWVRYT